WDALQSVIDGIEAILEGDGYDDPADIDQAIADLQDAIDGLEPTGRKICQDAVNKALADIAGSEDKEGYKTLLDMIEGIQADIDINGQSSEKFIHLASELEHAVTEFLES
ncbi:hypothetical protein FWH30_03180, partial [Microgenomates group bacterium]|nr:hypothetical protein [Microgenomates group bacterium]